MQVATIIIKYFLLWHKLECFICSLFIVQCRKLSHVFSLSDIQIKHFLSRSRLQGTIALGCSPLTDYPVWLNLTIIHKFCIYLCWCWMRTSLQSFLAIHKSKTTWICIDTYCWVKCMSRTCFIRIFLMKLKFYIFWLTFKTYADT